KVLIVLDQPGRGKSDYISDGSSTVNPIPTKNPNNMLEPVRIWGNALAPNFGNGNGLPAVTSQAYNLVENTDWHYSADNSAALPGYKPYTYPHPLTLDPPSSVPSMPDSASSFGGNLHTKAKRWAKKQGKKEKKAKENSTNRIAERQKGPGE